MHFKKKPNSQDKQKYNIQKMQQLSDVNVLFTKWVKPANRFL